jgi:WD40 repeat protein
MEHVVQGDERATARIFDRSPDGVRDGACPYQGLAPFDAENSELFFGRARATRDLLGRLGRRLGDETRPRGSILLVSGASGVGKSSLLRAGAMPALATGMLPVDGSRHWPRLLMTPTATPLRTLAARWAETHGGSAETAYEQLRGDQGFSPDGRLVLIVDQFEELFTLVADERERQAFVRALHALAEGPQAAAVIIGVRADYWDRCAAYPQFAAAIQDGQVLVEPMTESDLRLAITGPAATVGLEIEPGLVETVLGDLRAGRDAADRYAAGALPLLSQALRNTWDRREDDRLTVRGYEESGRVRDAVQHTADEVFQGLSAEDRKIALRVFRRLTVIIAGGRVARRRATMSEIHAAAAAHSAAERGAGGSVGALVSAFADRRLLTLHEDTAEIAHDALLTAWPTLRRWLEPDLAAQAVYDQLIEDAAQWDEHRRDPAFLYRGGRLLSVQDTRPRWDHDTDSFPPPGPIVEGFIAASARAARRAGRTRRLVLAGLAVLSILALIAAGAAIKAAGDADRQRNLAVSRLLAEQSEVAGDPVTSALLAAAAWRIAPTQEARYRMLDVAARTGRAVLSGHTGAVTALVFSRDGSTIVTGGDDGTARLWATASRQPRGAPIAHPKRDCSGTGINAVAISPDGKVVATTCLGYIRFWDVATHRPLGVPVENESSVPAIAFSPDGRTLAAGRTDGTARLWDVATRSPRGDAIGRPARTGAFNPVNAVAFSPDGKLLATVGADNTARLWDAATHRQAGDALTGHDEPIQDLSFSPDGTTLATASTDGTARLWDLATHRQSGAALKDPAGTGGFNGIAYSPDGGRLATAGVNGFTRIWDAAGRRPLGTALADNRLPVRRAAFSPDGKILAVAGDDGMVRLGDPVAHQQTGATLPGLSAVAVSPDGKTLATAERDNTTRLWDVATQRPVGRPLRPADDRTIDRKGALFGLTFSPDGGMLATAGLDGVRLFDTAGRRQIGPPLYAERPIGTVEFSPDGKRLAIARNGAIQFWQLAARRQTGPRIHVPDHTNLLSAMAISADGATLATVGGDRTVRLFDVATGRQRGAPIPVAVNGILDELKFSPDGRTLAIAANNDTVRLWNISPRRQIGTLTGHNDWISEIAFSPDGKVVATGSADDTVRLWDLMTGRQIGIPLTGHTHAVTGIAYTPDGATVATVADDETARLWNVAVPADPVATTCANAGRSLTRAEWERYIPGLRFREICR